MSHSRKIVLLFGGVSPEHEVSINSAAESGAAIDMLGTVQVTPVYIARDGLWHWARTSAEKSTRELVLAVNDDETMHRLYEPSSLDFAQALLHLMVDEVDCVMIMMHGANGEDGRLQGAFELARIPFTGSGSAASALAMDKTRCQAYLAARRLPVAPFVAVQDGRHSAAEAEAIIRKEINVPCVIKPALCGSSVGLTVVQDDSELSEAIKTAYKFSPLVLAERFLSGAEFTCGVLDLKGEATAMPVTQIIPPEGRFFDFEAKYTPGQTSEITPAEIDDTLSEKIRHIAAEAHVAVGCEGFSRVDFMLDASGEPHVIEINTIPGMTGTSLLPQGADAHGIDMPHLMEHFIEHAIERAANEKNEREGAGCDHA